MSDREDTISALFVLLHQLQGEARRIAANIDAVERAIAMIERETNSQQESEQ